MTRECSFIKASRVGAFIVLAMIGVSPSAYAWDSPEHVAISRSAYAQACKDLRQVSPIDRQEAIRLEAVCPAKVEEIARSECRPSTTMDDLRDATSSAGYPFAFADLVSRGASLAGDYFQRTEDFDSVEADRRLPSLFSYLMLASDNADHFYPRVTIRMNEEIVAAEELANEAYLAANDVPKHNLLLGRAAIHLMFALHFAQDSFAAGHMGFNRAGSSAGPSQRLHAAFNDVGRVVQTRDGAPLRLYGDQHYCAMTARSKHYVVGASARVLVRVLGTYVFGSAKMISSAIAPLSLDPDAYLPEYVQVAPALAYHDLRRGYMVSYVAPPEMQPVAGIGGSARQSVSLGFGALYAQQAVLPGFSGMYIPGKGEETIADIGVVADLAGGIGRKYRAASGPGVRIGFLGTGFSTIEVCLLGGLTGRWNESGQHQVFFEPRAQALIELGDVAYVRVAAGYDFGTNDSSGVVAFMTVGALIGAYGGGALDVRDISRGF
jgi:hypothetical protein